MNYEFLVNKDNPLDKTYIPLDLVNSNSNYRDGILVNKKALEELDDALSLANYYFIDFLPVTVHR